MNPSLENFNRVHYELRPAKQVERRMIVDSLIKLASAGFDISDYQYTGMGSIYFVDFIVFHKSLGINKMLSVEISRKARKRVEFNKPFQFVDVRMGRIGVQIPRLSQDRRHILWLDYNNVLGDEIVQDANRAASTLPPGSLILVTVDVEPTEPDVSPQAMRREYLESFGDFVPSKLRVDDFGISRLHIASARVLETAIGAGLEGRPDVDFLPIYNFVYKDGHKMLSYGGMIGGESERNKLDASGLSKTVYARLERESEPFTITVPKITRKERHFLDTNMPCEDSWKPTEFEMTRSDILAYRDIYRFFPPYAELAF